MFIFFFMIVQAYDIGGTWIRAAHVQDGQLGSIFKERTRKNFLAQIKEMSQGLGEADCLSLALPGPVKDGVLYCAPPLGITQKINIREELSYVHRRIVVENDVTAAAYAEIYSPLGHGKEGEGWNNFYLLTLSTGIGAGIILDGKVVRGGEFGHNPVSPIQSLHQLCSCGRRDCWCAFSSGRGIEKLAKEFTTYKTTTEVFTGYRRGEEPAKWLINIVRNANAQGLGMMVNALEIEGIVIMGSLGLKQFDILLPTKEEIQKSAINPVPTIVKTQLGDSIGLLGAYYRALQ